LSCLVAPPGLEPGSKV